MAAREKRFCVYCGERVGRRHWEGRDRLYCETCGPLYENPVPSACVILLDNSDRLLLVRRSVPPGLGQWCLPGGFMELGESPRETALRELYEETGIQGRIARILDADATPNRDYNTVALICFLVREYSGRPQAGDDADEVGFFRADALPAVAFESHLRFIQDFFRER
jgi:ADP-ribose pyrophosphatase YjhB (NUDIX family)